MPGTKICQEDQTKGMNNQYWQRLFPTTTDFAQVNLVIVFPRAPALEVRTDPLSQRPESKMLKVYIPVSMQRVDRNGTVEAERVET